MLCISYGERTPNSPLASRVERGGWRLGDERVGRSLAGGSLPSRVVVGAHPTRLPGEWGRGQPPSPDAKREKPLVRVSILAVASCHAFSVAPIVRLFSSRRHVVLLTLEKDKRLFASPLLTRSILSLSRFFLSPSFSPGLARKCPVCGRHSPRIESDLQPAVSGRKSSYSARGRKECAFARSN